MIKIVETNRAAGGVIRSTPSVMPHTQEKLVDQTLSHAVNTGIDDSFEGEETLPEQIVEENTTGDSNKLASDVVVHTEHNIEDEELVTN